MSTLANRIEQYLKALLAESKDGAIALRRSDLAEAFMCAPSQINYVLETRFNPSRGYYVESRRGGGGYLRLVRLSINENDGLGEVIREAENRSVSQQNGEDLLNRLVEEGFLSPREGKMLASLVADDVIGKTYMDETYLRSKMLQTVLINLLREDWDKGE